MRIYARIEKRVYARTYARVVVGTWDWRGRCDVRELFRVPGVILRGNYTLWRVKRVRRVMQCIKTDGTAKEECRRVLFEYYTLIDFSVGWGMGRGASSLLGVVNHSRTGKITTSYMENEDHRYGGLRR